MLKKLTVFSIRSFAGPFVVTFFISMFMLILQFTWVYIDDLMGKGLGAWVILELMLYVSASIIPLALPLAILLSSIMTMGNLAENNELTALKSSGLSLFRILRPLIQVVTLIAIGIFFFSNYVIPVANLKWHSIIFDIQETKVGMLVTPGTYSQELEGYAIKVKSGEGNTFQGITIHDYTNPGVSKTIKADSGTIYQGDHRKYLLFHLTNGVIHEEMNIQPPLFTTDGKLFHSGSEYRPSRNTQFKLATYKMNLVGFDMQRTDEELFKNDYEMLNVFQITDAKDSLERKLVHTNTMNVNANLGRLPFYQSINYAKSLSKRTSQKMPAFKDPAIPAKIISLHSLSKLERYRAMQNAIGNIRTLKASLQDQGELQKSIQHNYIMYQIEFHRKFALSAAIIVLFFVGAPLGAIVRKGGFGTPVVIAALLFMIYFVLFSIGENLANEEVLSPFWGMWLPTLVLSPIAGILMIAAANDLGIFDKKLWRYILSFGRKR